MWGEGGCDCQLFRNSVGGCLKRVVHACPRAVLTPADKRSWNAEVWGEILWEIVILVILTAKRNTMEFIYGAPMVESECKFLVSLSAGRFQQLFYLCLWDFKHPYVKLSFWSSFSSNMKQSNWLLSSNSFILSEVQPYMSIRLFGYMDELMTVLYICEFMSNCDSIASPCTRSTGVLPVNKFWDNLREVFVLNFHHHPLFKVSDRRGIISAYVAYIQLTWQYCQRLGGMDWVTVVRFSRTQSYNPPTSPLLLSLNVSLSQNLTRIFHP